MRPGLSKERILDAAREVLAHEPRAGFTMRRLAEHLDVTPMALYKWFANKDALLDALTAQVLDDAPDGPAAVAATDAPWLDRGVAYATRIRTNLLHHLPLLQVEGASQRLGARMFHTADEGLSLMLELGYEGRDAVDAYRVLFWSVLDHCLVIDATDAMPAVSRGGSVVERLTALGGEDAIAAMPVLAAHLPLFTAVDPDAFFAQVVRTVLLGLRANAPSALSRPSD